MTRKWDRWCNSTRRLARACDRLLFTYLNEHSFNLRPQLKAFPFSQKQINQMLAVENCARETGSCDDNALAWRVLITEMAAQSHSENLACVLAIWVWLLMVSFRFL